MSSLMQDLLIPPKRFTALDGQFTFPKDAVFASPRTCDLAPLGQLAADLNRMGIRARIERNAFGPAAVRVQRVKSLPFKGPDANVAGDAYRMMISPDGVVIQSTGDAGAYYAVQTLREMLKAKSMAANSGRHGTLPCGVIADWPDFGRRGVYLDCSRGKVPMVATIKALVERLAAAKVNELQLYVENVFTFKRHPLIGKGYSPFTPEELLEVQDFCKLHHVRFVGSLASFGHLEKILRLPQYAHLAERPGETAGEIGVMTLAPTDPRSIKFVGELYEEFVPLFEALDFNVCCDETWDLGKGRSKKLADKVGVGKVYLDFLLKLRALCEKHGKRTNAWADICLQHKEILPQLPRDIVMLNWSYEANGWNIPRTHEITEVGLPCVICPGVGSWQSHGSRMTESMINISQFAAEGRKRGAEGLLNTDWGDFGHRNFLAVSLHGYAFGAAQAWNGRGVDNKTFTRTFCRQWFGAVADELVKPLQLLGNAYLHASEVPGNNTNLYWALVEPFDGKTTEHGRRIDKMPAKGLRRIEADLCQAMWPAATKGMDQFEALALQEYKLSALEDCLAARRAMFVKQWRAGQAPPKAPMRRLAADIHRMSDEFSRLWLASNKQSRLADNMALYKGIEKEAAKLGK